MGWSASYLYSPDFAEFFWNFFWSGANSRIKSGAVTWTVFGWVGERVGKRVPGTILVSGDLYWVTGVAATAAYT